MELDDVDRGILHMLQEDARNDSATQIADAVGVAPNTVRNPIERLEENGVIQGYHPHIDYEQAGYQLRVIFTCTVRVAKRREFADSALGIEGVVAVTESLSGYGNLAVEAVGETSDELTRITAEVEELGPVIRDERFVKNSHVRPFDQFGPEDAEEN
jgi:DNA-binding Lrp family transcriptional regulator